MSGADTRASDVGRTEYAFWWAEPSLDEMPYPPESRQFLRKVGKEMEVQRSTGDVSFQALANWLAGIQSFRASEHFLVLEN